MEMITINLEKILSRCIPNEGCLEWKGYRTPYGYGQIRIGGRKGKTWLTHRAAFTAAYFEIPVGMVICHSCDNPPCCNPKHLFMGTHADNVKDRVSKGRTRTGRKIKLSHEDTIYIKTSGERGVDLAIKYGVTPHHISRVRRGKFWGGVNA